jgi:hypothetical protein
MRVLRSDLVKRKRVYRWDDEEVAAIQTAEKGARTVEPEISLRGGPHKNYCGFYEPVQYL